MFYFLSNIEGITANDIQDYFNSLKHLSKITTKEHKTFLTQIFDSAMEDGIIMKTPSTVSGLPTPAGKARAFTSSLLRQ